MAAETPRTLRSDLEALRCHAASLAREAERVLESATAREPYLSAAAAFGIGFLLGGGLPRGAATMLAGAGARLAAARFGEEIFNRAGIGGDGSDREEPG